ncbi:hypothetical protein MPTK1_5g12180 [Marchantia polymorpha subsp. ruderalis]|uniref:Uncharacterized protein n=2 Tax=Marchantia polymorpha TaxID=3197 RepID=A0AAF6BHI9_MARPO|nr:hypothetical protein MARPO_0274s0003 [Marchantia polymorpha]BBN11473.1 hypothetical protein Mp_5g12180 [Marchantia polymorpha subsp. ruderalis]|eukprot:PTQ26903.1 hypothetical protein MARPO_0274s0003 [Marchantia polymorpha]
MATSGTLSAPLMSSSAVGTRGEVEPLLERDLAAEPATSSDTPLTPWSAFLNNVTNGISNLANLLPTGTFLAFTTIAPIITDNGTCDQPSELWLSVAATIFFAAFCFFSCFTDSFVASDGKVYLGVVTFFGLWTPQLPTGLQPTDQGAYRLKFSDIVYAFLSLAVFTACALMTPNIRSCLFPELSATVVQTVPAVVSFVVSAVFTLFPSKRHGIGFPVSPISSSSQGTTTI